MNCYVVLGVQPNADADTIRRAFRALARRFHPDVGVGSSADRFRDIVTAYETLNDPERRRRHDGMLQHQRARITQIVESLRGQNAPEPMISGQKGVGPFGGVAPRSLTRLDELFDEWVRSWNEGLFIGRRHGNGF
jgi:curved DNA-binding protein CbpA